MTNSGLHPELAALIKGSNLRYTTDPTPLSEFLDQDSELQDGSTHRDMLDMLFENIEGTVQFMHKSIQLKSEAEQTEAFLSGLAQIQMTGASIAMLFNEFRATRRSAI